MRAELTNHPEILESRLIGRTFVSETKDRGSSPRTPAKFAD